MRAPVAVTDQIPFTSIQFPFYELLKRQLSIHYLNGERPSPAQAAVCGMIAGGTAGAITTPLDVVKTRVMLEAKVSDGCLATQSRAHGSQREASGIRTPSPSVLSFGPRLLAILRNEGPRALFGGWIPRTVAISCGGAVFLGIYDFAVNVALK